MVWKNQTMTDKCYYSYLPKTVLKLKFAFRKERKGNFTYSLPCSFTVQAALALLHSISSIAEELLVCTL